MSNFMKMIMKKWKWKLLILLYLCFIYGNSLTPAVISSKESGYFLIRIQNLLSGAGIDARWLTEHLVRKAAHFTEYAGLGFLLAMNTGAGMAPVFSLTMYIKETPMVRPLITKILKANFTAALFMPFIDETIQLFVEGRSGQISDVWLDMAGIFTGIIVTVCLVKILWTVLKKMEKSRQD